MTQILALTALAFGVIIGIVMYPVWKKTNSPKGELIIYNNGRKF